MSTDNPMDEDKEAKDATQRRCSAHDGTFEPPSVTSLTSADIDPQLLENQKPVSPQSQRLQQHLSELQIPDVAPIRQEHRLSMRRNTVPLVNRGSTPPPQVRRQQSARPPASQQKVCRYCLNLFDEAANWKGACPDAPDRVKSWIERLTCLTLADGVSYHCCADSEGDYIQPCQLGSSSSNADVRGASRRCRRRGPDDDDDEDDYDDCEAGGRRADVAGGGGRASLLDRLKAWSCVCLLALCVPCLCCYPLCSLGHRGCRRLRVAGGKHAALWTAPAGVCRDPTRNTIAGETAPPALAATATSSVAPGGVSVA